VLAGAREYGERDTFGAGQGPFRRVFFPSGFFSRDGWKKWATSNVSVRYVRVQGAVVSEFDAEDLRLWREGDLLAFERVVLRHQGAVYHFALRLLGDPDGAGDAAQETFIRAYQGIQGFREGSALRTWLFSICRNLALDELRRRRRRTERERPLDGVGGHDDGPAPHWVVDHAVSIEDDAVRRELGRKLSEAIDALPEEQRSAVILKDRHGLSSEEIAQVLGVPVGTVFSRIHRAYRKLATALTPYVAAEEEEVSLP
jgi:RNA polymerase sigma-70 factor (ECF subfamily)